MLMIMAYARANFITTPPYNITLIISIGRRATVDVLVCRMQRFRLKLFAHNTVKRRCCRRRFHLG